MNNKWYREYMPARPTSRWTVFAIKSFSSSQFPREPLLNDFESLNTYEERRRKSIANNEEKNVYQFSPRRGERKFGCRTYEQQQNSNRCSNYWFISHSFWIFLFSREQLQLKQKIFIESGLRAGGWISNLLKRGIKIADNLAGSYGISKNRAIESGFFQSSDPLQHNSTMNGG